ncbi:MAG: YajD family HNH nuclease [Gammaproteobacteria bacterium]
MTQKNHHRSKLDRAVEDARKNREQRDEGYRARALKMYPWICGRCMREFDRSNLHELTVHHRDHDHDNNPEDGSNWELLCLYCHDNEHQRQIERATRDDKKSHEIASHKPFADLGSLLKKQD